MLAAVAAPFTAHADGDFEIKKDDFKELFNKVRFGQPDAVPWPGTFWPYGYAGTSAKVDKSGNYVEGSGSGTSPMEAFDKIAGEGSNANDWEKKNHTCETIKDPEEKSGCEGWWGHCNGWAAAAIKEDEPKKGFAVNGTALATADVKGILSEVWLSTNSLFEGDTNKSTKTSELLKSGALEKPNSSAYRAFWDVTPRSLFLILTNYIGLGKIGIAIDRFTGDQVWNQPLIGYRILPIEPSAITVSSRGGAKVWAVPMTLKIYWANDGVSPGIVSKGFNIEKDTSDSPEAETNLPTALNGEDAYTARALQFTLFFDAEVAVSPDGKKVLTAGNIVGDGIWKMQENPRSYSAGALDQGHPDFVWLPTNWILDSSGGYGNPYMATRVVQAISKANKAANGKGSDGGGSGGTSNAAVSYHIVFASGAFANLQEINPKSVKRKIYRLMNRAGLKASIPTDSVEVRGGVVRLDMTFVDGADEKALLAVFEDANMAVTKIEKVQ